jgi:hypothetical protein
VETRNHSKNGVKSKSQMSIKKKVMKSKSITSVTFILIGNMLFIYSSIGSGWTASLTAIFGIILFFIGLSRLKSYLDKTGQNGVSKLIWAAILVIIASALSYIPIVGIIPAGIINIIAFILLIIGLFNLKKSETLGETGAKGVNYLLVAMVLMIIVSLIGIVPLVGKLIKPVISFIAFILIPFGWLKIQEAIIIELGDQSLRENKYNHTYLSEKLANNNVKIISQNILKESSFAEGSYENIQLEFADGIKGSVFYIKAKKLYYFNEKSKRNALLYYYDNFTNCVNAFHNFESTGQILKVGFVGSYS